MIYFYKSSKKQDGLIHPVTIIATNETKAYALCVLNFKKHNMVGTPKRIQV